MKTKEIAVDRRSWVAFEPMLDLLRFHLLKVKGEWPALAVKAGVTYRWIISFAAGDYDVVRIDNVQKLAEALDLSVMYSIEKKAGGRNASRKSG